MKANPGKIVLIIILMLMSFGARAGMSGTYTIDSSKAASSTNYKTIISATRALQKLGLSPGIYLLHIKINDQIVNKPVAIKGE